jgi:hypothetical protein
MDNPTRDETRAMIAAGLRTMREWGVECRDYEPLCACCQAWRLFNQTHRFPTDQQVEAAITEAMKEAA